MKSIHNTTQKFLKNIFIKKDPLLGELLLNWNKIVGKELSKNTYPVKILNLSSINSGSPGPTIEEKSKILLIAVPINSLVTKIYYSQPRILERISVFTGNTSIKKIKIAKDL